MRPLHRLANWDITMGHAPFVLFLMTWAACGAVAFWASQEPATDHSGDHPQGGFALLAGLVFVVALIQSAVRLWNWEERRERAEQASQDRIAELEAELGIDS